MDQQTIDTYNKKAREYDDETVSFWQDIPKTFVNKFAELSGENIINVGSGPGRDGLLLQQLGKKVTCVDASEEMIKLSAERGLNSILADFNNLPFPDKSFDAVWSYTAILHVPKDSVKRSLGEISRVLKPSGIFALGLIEGDGEGYRESSGVNSPRWFSFYQKDEIVDLCSSLGFDLVYFDTFKPRSKNYLNFIFRKH